MLEIFNNLKALKDFITLSNITSNIKLPSSFDGLSKLLMKSDLKEIYTKSWFCGVCLTSFNNLDNRFQRSCEKCQVKLNMFYYLDIEHQIKKIFSNVDLNKIRTPTSTPANNLTHISDGRLYKKMLNSEDGPYFKKKEAFSFLLNTDGISICKKSKLTIWPFYLTINELPNQFDFENLILAGIKMLNNLVA